jgi:glycerophosphoryl diester phosphodiesterase
LRESAADCCIEIKDPERYPPTLEPEIISLVYECGMERRVRMLSFSAQSIRKVKMLDGSFPTAILISGRENDPVKAAINVSADELAIRHDLIGGAIVDSAHAHGISVAAWTADREKDMLRLISLGVDRIITNYPDRLRRFL